MARAVLGGPAAAMPMYGRSTSSSRSMSLRDVMEANGANHNEVFSTTDSVLEEESSIQEFPSPMQKFSRALKRLRGMQKFTSSDPQHFKTGSAQWQIQIKQLISRPEVRQHVAFLAPITDIHCDNAPEQASKVSFKSLNALRASSPGMIIWNMIQVVLLLYIIIYIPFRVSFANIDDSGCTKAYVVQGIDLFVDTFYLIDLVVSACTQSVNNQGLSLLQLKDTVPHYVWSWVFVRDLAPAIPMSWIEFNMYEIESCASSSGSNVGLAKLLRIMRIFRILRVFKVFNVKFINDSLRHVDPNMKTLVSLFLSLLLLVHFLASIWFFVKKESSSISSWYIEQGLNSGANRPLRVYLTCVYYIAATLATVGFGDVVADHEDERMISMGIMLLGTVVFALIISTASMIVQSANVEESAHGSKIAMVHEFCANWKLNEKMKYEILDFFLSSKDIFLENANIRSVMSSLPPEYQSIVAPHVAKECLNKTVLFKDCSPEFISLLLEHLSLESYGAGETLFQTGDISDGIYIIKSGTCLIVNENDAIISELSDSDIMGEVSCFQSKLRTCTCVCSKFCEIYVLRVSQLAKIFKTFPDFMKAFSIYCRRKTLVDLSTKHQFSSALQKFYSQRAPLSPQSPSISPTLSSQQPTPTLSLHARPLKPLPKGKYRAPFVPDLADKIVTFRTSESLHAERIRLFAEIQVMRACFYAVANCL